MICELCRGSCKDRPTESEPLLIDCEGEEVAITECPQKIIGADVSQCMALSDFARHGALPESGGVMDQTVSVVEAIGFTQGLEAPHRVKAGLKDG